MNLKPIIVSSFCLMFLNLSAQKFYHTVGAHYLQSYGSYGNYDRLSIQAAPQLYFEKKSLIYGLAMPITMGVITSSSRSEGLTVMEVPLMLELGYNPNAPCVNYQAMSFFAGAGVSKQVLPVLADQQALYYNAVLGWRFKIRNVPFELRLTGSKPFVNTSSQYRIGYSIATAL